MADESRIQRVIAQNFYMRSRYGEVQLDSKYGLTREEIAAKILAQDGKCDDCKQDLSGKKWCVDHDHKTKQVRGVLCYRCNTAVRAREQMRQHIEYLRRYGVEI